MIKTIIAIVVVAILLGGCTWVSIRGFYNTDSDNIDKKEK